MAKLTHLDEKGRASMVDVGDKPTTDRRATARSRVTLSAQAFDALVSGELEKGEALAVARIAGISAAKRTADLIPLCHQIALASVAVSFEPDADAHRVDIVVDVRTTAQTGVEMEAMTAASIAALTIYDMCKGIDRSIVIGPTLLERKTGGKSGNFLRS